MAAPSQAITWKLYGIEKKDRVCSTCGRRFKHIDECHWWQEYPVKALFCDAKCWKERER